MKTDLDTLEERISRHREPRQPPLHLWNPPLSGDIDILIAADGSWYHDGARIQRDALVNLFASILRREEDGEYYLVTPVEKWRIRVELHPLIVTDIDLAEQAGQTVLLATLSTGRQIPVTDSEQWFMEPALGDIAAIRLPYGLTALLSRPAWYRLVDLAEATEEGLRVGGLLLKTSGEPGGE